MILYFSGTGNSRYAAEYIGQIIQDEVIDIGSQMKEGKNGAEFTSEKPFVFVCPVYGWRIPRIVENFIRTSAFRGSTEAYFVITCGTDIGNAEHYAANLCAEKRLALKGVTPIVMPENYIAMFRAPGHDEAEQILQGSDQAIRETALKIKEHKTLESSHIGMIDRLKSGIVNRVFYALCIKAKGFHTTESCTGCGICRQVCSLNNIRMEGNRPIWGNDCTHCMACICRCPEEAIEYNRASIGKVRYYNDKKPPKAE